MAKKKHGGAFVEGLSLKALLEVQAQGHCVAKQLARAGHSDKITVHTQKQANVIHETGGPRPSLNNKYRVSAKDLRTMDNIVFSSKTEMLCYKILRDSGIEFHIQPSFELQPGIEVEGKKERAIVYKGDFLIGPLRATAQEPLLDSQIVVDVKGMRVPVYMIKRKMFAAKFGRQVIEIKNAGEMTKFVFDYKNKNAKQSDVQPCVGHRVLGGNT
jgi:hypothetical protein